MTSNRTRGGWDRQPPVADAALRDSVLRVTARDSRTYGFALARLRATRRFTLAEQAAALGLSEPALVFLSLFRLPRPTHREQDLAATSTAIGIGIEVLRGLLVGATAPTGGVS